jgi:hypothetical protein
MPETFPTNDFEEFRKQYGDTVIRMRTTKSLGPFVPVYVHSDLPPNLGHVYVDHPTLGTMNVQWNSSTYEWQFDLPERGLFNYANIVGLYIRVPKRQWKRGLCGGTSYCDWITRPWRERLNRLTIPAIGLLHLPMVHTLFNRVFKSWDVALDDLLESRSCEEALSLKFACTLCPHELGKKILLFWYEDQIIGEIYPIERYVMVYQTIFLQEVRDFFIRNKVSWQVKSLTTSI